MVQPRFVPWSRVSSWFCDGCGECCKWFTVNVTMHEYAAICHNYSYDVLELGVGGAYLRKRPDGRCIFQFKQGSGWLCGLQAMKPYV